MTCVFTSLVLGELFSCGLETNGGVVCWGYVNEPEPALAFRNLATNGNQICGQLESGELFCWNGFRRSRFDFVTDDALPPFSKLAVGAKKVHAIREADGGLYSWTVTGDLVAEPTPNEGLRDVASLREGGVPDGGQFTCAVEADGKLDCWGDFGPIAYEDLREDLAPETFESLSIGKYNACAVGSKTSCWGADHNGGISTYAISSLMPSESRFRQVAVGDDFACGVTEPSGYIHCWLFPNDQIPAGNKVVEGFPREPGFSSIAAGPYHACGLTAAGQAKCWGNNVVNQGLPYEKSGWAEAPTMCTSAPTAMPTEGQKLGEDSPNPNTTPAPTLSPTTKSLWIAAWVLAVVTFVLLASVCLFKSSACCGNKDEEEEAVEDAETTLLQEQVVSSTV